MSLYLYNFSENLRKISKDKQRLGYFFEAFRAFDENN